MLVDAGFLSMVKQLMFDEEAVNYILSMFCKNDFSKTVVFRFIVGDKRDTFWNMEVEAVEQAKFSQLVLSNRKIKVRIQVLWFYTNCRLLFDYYSFL